MSAQVNNDSDKEVYPKTFIYSKRSYLHFLTPFRLPVSLELQPKYSISQLALLKFLRELINLIGLNWELSPG